MCTCRCGPICHLICVFRVHSGYTSVILTHRLCLCACLHVSDCPGADARHIIVNPIICLVYTNALIWRGVPSTVAWDHNVISIQYIKREVLQFGQGIAVTCNTVCVCVFVTMLSLTPGTYLSRATLVRVLR